MEHEADDRSSTTATTSSSTSTTGEPTAPTATDRRGEASRLFTQLVDDHCDQTMVPPGHLATVGEPDGPRFPITDADGVLLVLDIDRRVVTSPEGDEGILPRSYSFGCDPQVFLGTLDH